MMLCCTCYVTAMLLVWRRHRRRIRAPIAVSWASASSCAHNTLIVTGTVLSSGTCGATAAYQHIHDVGGSREGSPGWYPADFRFDPTTEARARQQLLGDEGLAPYISSLVCRSVNSCLAMKDWLHTYQLGMSFCQQLLGDEGLAPYISSLVCRSVNMLYQYLLVLLVDIRQSTRNRIQWNDEALDDSGNFPFPSCRIRCLIPAPLLCMVVAVKLSGR